MNYEYENRLIVSLIIIGSTITITGLVGGYYASIAIISLI